MAKSAGLQSFDFQARRVEGIGWQHPFRLDFLCEPSEPGQRGKTATGCYVLLSGVQGYSIFIILGEILFQLGKPLLTYDITLWICYDSAVNRLARLNFCKCKKSIVRTLFC